MCDFPDCPDLTRKLCPEHGDKSELRVFRPQYDGNGGLLYVVLEKEDGPRVHVPRAHHFMEFHS